MIHTTSPDRHRRFARYAALLAVPLLVGVLAACSGGDSKPSEKPVGQEQTFQDWQVSFAACMRDEGIDYPDPEPDGSMKAGQVLSGDEAKAMETASEACLGKIGEPPAGPGGKKTDAEIREEGLKVAKCFRDNGYDMVDPEGNGLTIPDAPKDVTEKCLAAGGMSSSAK